ncbi:hypothetical protein [Bacillus pseudomycoides]|uniref:hypothetical protein n=1 Tax=Bacillus pseudomycoides TaxID=64104 RepID=UPI001FB55EF3|nr:hypothetical protein [Bacillus pseudomycoides]
MVRKNIFSLTLAMLVSCIALLFLQSSIVYAETNQEQKNGIKYVNKKLGFSLNIPKSWEGNYKIKEEDGRVSFLFTYKGKINDAIPPLFTISLEDKKEEGWNKGIRWTGELGTKGNMGYYSYYDALHLYLEGTSPGEEQDTVSTMVTQVFDIFNTFKILETNEAGAKGATAEEAKPKEQGKNGGTAEKETNRETANGIKYVNEDLGFELTVPKIWKNHYIVEENDNGGVTFKFKFDSKVYDDIYLFNIYVENREYSKEEQETMGDVGILDVKNGKTYLIIENLAMYAPPQAFDKYFSSVPKEGRNVIKVMSKQKKILNFKVLGKKGAETEEIKGKQGEIPEKSQENFGAIGETLEPTDVTFYKKTTTSPHVELQTFYILKTPINNIRTEVIKKPVSETKYTGINGGFYAPSYISELDYSEYKPYNISYYNPDKVTDGSDEINEINGLHRKGEDAEKEEEKNEPKPYSLPTLVTYYDKDLQKTKAKIIKVKNLDEIRDHFKDIPNLELINAIGGKGFKEEYWGGEGFDEKFKNYYAGPARRTILTFEEDEDKGIVYAYLIITANDVAVQTLIPHLESLGFNKENCILLDGSGSSSMRVWDSRKDKLIFLDKGTENRLGSKLEKFFEYQPNFWEKKFWDILLADPPIGNRFSYNMIRVINSDDIRLGEPEE